MDHFIFSFIKFIPRWILPNHLSIIRIILLIPIIILLKAEQNLMAALIFIFACLLDIFDGVLARKRSQITKVGEWLDAYADKILIIGILLTYGWKFDLPQWLIIAIIILEILLILSRPLKNKFGKSGGANEWGKIKMGFQSAAVIGLILGTILIKPVVVLLLISAVGFALLSLLTHLKQIFVS